jgi:hypothetical protein
MSIRPCEVGFKTFWPLSGRDNGARGRHECHRERVSRQVEENA